MALLSANTLFHFTKKKEFLLGILETGFRPGYCKENFSLENLPGETRIPDNCHVPMVSFCDIPLSQIQNHVLEYSTEKKGYGLGMKIKWGVRNGVSPVTYVPVRNADRDQDISSLYSMVQGLYAMNVFSLDENTISVGVDSRAAREIAWQMVPSLVLLMCYLKPYNGKQNDLFRKFYDEKEWRYIPGFSSFPNMNPFFLRIPSFDVSENEHEAMKNHFLTIRFEELLRMTLDQALEAGRAAVWNKYLVFDPSDINYIIVDSDNDIEEVIDKLKSLNYKYNDSDIRRLTTRIITYEQIRNDF